MQEKKKRYWLSFDLGLRGNYEELYIWLDNMKALECGENIATFVTDKSVKQINEELAKFLKKSVRIYIIAKSGGKFILGRRKRPSWAGYGGPEYTGKVDTT